MLDSKSTFEDAEEPIRKFGILFVCVDCEEPHIIEAEALYIKGWFGENDILGSLMRYHPFCCADCGGDEFTIEAWTERK